MSRAGHDSPCPDEVDAFARQTVDYVQKAVGLELEYDSETLPVLDHYLRAVPDKPALILLTSTTAGAYFGEVVRKALGGRWDLSSGDPETWRFVLPTGLSFAPAGVVAEAIAMSDSAEIDSGFDAPAVMRPHLEAALARMGELPLDEYYSLCGRFDTLEHLQAVLLAVAVELAKRKQRN